MKAQQMASKRDELRKRLSREEGRQLQKEEQFQALQQQAEERFGTSDLNKLAHIYDDIKKQRAELQQTIERGYELAEEALAYLESDRPIPGDLVSQIESIAKVGGDDTADEAPASDENNTQEGFNAEFDAQDMPEEDTGDIHPLTKTVADSRAAAQQQSPSTQTRVKNQPAKPSSSDSFDL